MRLYLISALALLAGCSQGNSPEKEAVDEAAPHEIQPTEPAPEESSAVPSVEAAAAAATAEPEVIEGIENRRVSFDAGANSKTVEGSITGYQTVDYILNVKQGQPLNISMATQNTATYFNILEPGETQVAIFNGSMGENMFEGTAAKSGDYRIRVYMMRSAARRDEKADYRLEMIAG